MFEETTRIKRMSTSADDELDITPMIDVTFLLLIFFMVTSKMEKTSDLQIPPARHGVGVSQDQSIVITIFKTDNGGETYLANGEKKNGPVDAAGVTAYVQEGVSADRHNVIIKADRDLPSGVVDEVVRAANEADIGNEELKFYLGVIDRPQ